jgi:hypothetical protein
MIACHNTVKSNQSINWLFLSGYKKHIVGKDYIDAHNGEEGVRSEKLSHKNAIKHEKRDR